MEPATAANKDDDMRSVWSVAARWLFGQEANTVMLFLLVVVGVALAAPDAAETVLADYRATGLSLAQHPVALLRERHARAHAGMHEHVVADADAEVEMVKEIEVLGRQDRVDLVVGDVASLLALLNQLLEFGSERVEQGRIGPFFTGIGDFGLGYSCGFGRHY